jgi:hypothetical protein
MADRALYFPYMRVPDSPALTRVLLYWDELGVIWPAAAPPPRTERMKALVGSGLVVQVDLGRLQDPWKPYSEFLRLLQDSGIARDLWNRTAPGERGEPVVSENEMEEFPAAFADESSRVFQIHVAKSPDEFSLWSQIEAWGGARPAETADWMLVERRVGLLYLAVLAAHVGRAEGMAPITDRGQLLSRMGVGRGGLTTLELFDRMRGAVIRDALPAPSDPVSVRDLVAFKERHRELLRSFRRYVERELVECARERDEDLRSMMLVELASEIRDRVAELHAKMSERRWPTVPGLLCAAVSSAPAAFQAATGSDAIAAASVATTALAEVMRSALTGPLAAIEGSPMAYAALAQQEFG